MTKENVEQAFIDLIRAILKRLMNGENLSLPKAAGTKPRGTDVIPYPLNVSASDSKSQTETQGVSIEMQARLPVVDSDEAQIRRRFNFDAGAELADARVLWSIFADGGSAVPPAPSDAVKAEKRMLDVIHEVMHADLTTDKESVIRCMKMFSDNCQFAELPNSVMKNFLHPLHTCIKLSAAMMIFSRSQRSRDIRLANDMDEKAAEMEQLACAIIRGCEDTTLFGQELDDCLQLAADFKLKFFISEPACSRRIEELWWTDRSITRLLLATFFWISGLNFVFNHYNLSSRTGTPPFVRFLINRASYLAFLVCLLQLPVQAAPGDPVLNIGLEIFLSYWLFDICFSEAAEFHDIKKKYRLTAFKAVAKYAEDPWNVYDVITLSTAVAAAVVRGLVHAGVGNATTAASNQLYAWALALLWGRLVNVLSVVSLIGPLLIMVLAMIFRDLSKFAFLVMLMELPFVAALYFLESGNGGNEAFATFPDSALSFFKIVIGQGPDISSVTASSSVLLSLGSVLLSVLLLNLLIAMFSKTFDTIVENSTQEYLLQKAQLTFLWARAPRMPPPFACPLALKDWAMIHVSWHVWRYAHFAACCAGWEPYLDDDDDLCLYNCCPSYNPYDHRNDVKKMELGEPPPTFDRMHFYQIVFPNKFNYSPSQFDEQNAETLQREQFNKKFMTACDKKYNLWCKKVLDDLEENAEFNSEAQMDKFKSRMLRGMAITIESGKEVQEQMKALSGAVQSHATQNQLKVAQEQMKALSGAVQSHATQVQVKTLSDAVQSQHAQIEQMHASIQLILQKLNP